MSNSAEGYKDANEPPGIRIEARRTIANPKIKDIVTFVKYGAETNGEYTELRLKLAPGGEAGMHYHTLYTETFTALNGKLGVYTGSTGRLELEPGESRLVPVREVHYFFNPGEEDIECKIVVAPSHEGFEKSLYIMYGLARDGLCREKGVPNSFVHLCLILTLADIRPPGIVFTLVSPIVYLTAAIARWWEIEEDLLHRYWK
ncbi:hypothetical protein BP6252_13759 [Coleophoma cylindrospora]|uniref:Cupin type-2 domain-containing protein n=1 Tax=Coleophoma cylindrospora TaxID=1849047 RepID=A0A3D8Q6S7_9HELO|nr:hypothetical protein BP6252_13759 [Coleophoma cylindrospora]